MPITMIDEHLVGRQLLLTLRGQQMSGIRAGATVELQHVCRETGSKLCYVV